jgi:DNA-binding NtrC family response regulator
MVREKTFREDLFYRLSMVEITLPKLSDRREDIPLLLKHFVSKFSKQYGKPIRGITRRAQTLLLKYSWPGNIRQLENVIGNACMMAETDVVDVGDLDPTVRTAPPLDDAEAITLDDVCRVHARRILKQVQGNKAQAAQMLGVSRSTLYKLLEDAASEDPTQTLVEG